jgi:mono/diheme cytochrome c family protein
MRHPFLLGALSAAILMPLGVVAYAALGFVDVNADTAPPAWEAAIMRTAIHASVRRRASATPELPAASDSLVIAGGRRFLNDCVGCHGEPDKPPSTFGATFYPPAPQFPRVGTEYTPAQLMWVATHGIRFTGMSPQASSYTEPKLRSLVAFIGAVKTLPPALLDSIHAKPKP